MVAPGPTVAAQAVTCGFCGHRFVEDRGQAACAACPLSRACGLVRCPACGYENPRRPDWVGRLARLAQLRRRR